MKLAKLKQNVQLKVQLKDELLHLKEQYQARGLFNYGPHRLKRDYLLFTTTFTAALYTSVHSTRAAFFILQICSFYLVWWIHDVGHMAIYQNYKQAKSAADFWGILFWGMPQEKFHFSIHLRHHIFTNIVGLDPALDTGPITWHPGQSTRFEPPPRLKALTWFTIALLMTFPSIFCQTMSTFFKKSRWSWKLYFVLRWGLMTYFFQENLLLLFLPQIITGHYMGFIASLNHFHMPLTQKRYKDPLAAYFFTTQNLTHRSKLATFLTGGLNYHLEHHLFPTMPSAHLHLIHDDIKKLAKKYNLPYHECSMMEAIKRLNHKLHETQFTYSQAEVSP